MTLQRDILFAILFDPTRGVGSLYRYPSVYPTKAHKGRNFFWNREYDNKLYLQVDVPSSGSFSYAMHLQAFQASEEDYVSKGRALLANADGQGTSTSSQSAAAKTDDDGSKIRNLKVLNYDSWPFGNSTPDDYKLWDWTKLTDIITPYLPAQRPEVAALAERHKVKLITDWDTLLLTDAFMLQHNRR